MGSSGFHDRALSAAIICLKLRQVFFLLDAKYENCSVGGCGATNNSAVWVGVVLLIIVQCGWVWCY